MPQLKFEPGLPMPALEGGKIVVRQADGIDFQPLSINDLFKYVFGIIFVACVLFLVYKIVTQVSKSELLQIIKWMFLFIIMVGGALFLLLILLPKGNIQFSTPIPTPIPTEKIPTPLGSPPVALLWIVGAILLVGCIVFLIWITSSLGRKDKTVDLLRMEAEKAQAELLSGSDFNSTIINCYRQMSFALEKKNGIQREPFRTPHEFELSLQSIGFPIKPVHQLTGLFEVARYGHGQASQDDEKQALECLDAIVQYCFESQEG